MKTNSRRLWDFPSAAFLILALFAASQRLYATSWTPGLETALILTMLGVLVGLAIGISRFESWGVFWLTTGYSLILIPMVTAWILYQDVPWLERMISLGGRLGFSFQQFITLQPVPDTALFVVFTGAGFWFISLIAGYALTRHGDVVRAVAPAGILTFIIQLFDSRVGDRIIILAVYAALSLLLLGRQTYIHKRVAWKEQHVSISADSWTDINLAIPVVAIILVALAWVIPASAGPIAGVRHAWESLTNPLQQTRKDLSNAVAGLKSSDQVVGGDFYGSTLPLGTRASIGDSVYLNVRVPVTTSADRYYWRARTYDLYQNGQWSTSGTRDEPFTPGKDSILLADANGISAEFIFSAPRANLSVMITPAHVVWVSRPSVITYTPSNGNAIDPLIFTIDPPINVGEQYTVHANIFNPTILQLEQSGAEYPSWVMDHYLQLPDNLPAQITELAKQITAAAATPYDKAIAVTDYLRANITYSTTFTPAPEGTDPLVWFLFDQKSGFCNYYASAEVILLRSVGVPARMVVGFAQGEYQQPDKYVVRQKDAHAWPEVYFPTIGWVEFEPTSSQPALVRQEGNPNTGLTPAVTPEGGNQSTGQPGNEPVEAPGTGAQSGRQPNSLIRITIYFFIFILIIIGSVFAYTTGLFDRILKRSGRNPLQPLPILLTNIYTGLDLLPPAWLNRWAYYARLKPIERTYGVVYQSLRWLGHSPSPTQTPDEAATELMTLLPGARNDILTLAREYEHALFSQKHYDLYTSQRAGAAIRRQALIAALRRAMAAFLHVFLRSKKTNGE